MANNISQCTDTILMVRPFQFRFNEQTAINNYYMVKPDGSHEIEINRRALDQFDRFVEILSSKGVDVIVVQDNQDPDTPDAVFPNNWISLHEDGRIGLYPMYAPNRRLERRAEILEMLKERFKVDQIIDFTEYEAKGLFMEATGSMVLDRANKVAYAALSDRTNKMVFEEFCNVFNYKPVSFVANQTVNGERLPIYHTNVLMCVGDQFAVICLDAIDDHSERQMLMNEFDTQGQEVISISEKQTQQFAGNMLQIKSIKDEKYIIMSSAAFNSLNKNQIKAIEKYGEILHSPLDTIEKLGGGSARCMMAEVFLPRKKNYESQN